MSFGRPDDRFRILCVCTGNVFRSRIAEQLLRVELTDRLGPDAVAFEVASAGTGVADGRPVAASEAAALLRVGMTVDDQASRRLAAADVRGADLVLCADRTHRSAVLELVPGALRRTFLIPELARVASGAPPQPLLDTSAAGRVARARSVIAAAASRRASVPPDGSDEIPDPWGHGDEVLGSAVQVVRDAVPRILDPLVGGAGVGGGGDVGRQPRR